MEHGTADFSKTSNLRKRFETFTRDTRWRPHLLSVFPGDFDERRLVTAVRHAVSGGRAQEMTPVIKRTMYLVVIVALVCRLAWHVVFR